MIDHHVDRPDVDAQQCVKLTGTNRSIGLISCPSHAAINGSDDRCQMTDVRDQIPLHDRLSTAKLLQYSLTETDQMPLASDI